MQGPSVSWILCLHLPDSSLHNPRSCCRERSGTGPSPDPLLGACSVRARRLAVAPGDGPVAVPEGVSQTMLQFWWDAAAAAERRCPAVTMVMDMCLPLSMCGSVSAELSRVGVEEFHTICGQVDLLALAPRADAVYEIKTELCWNKCTSPATCHVTASD